MRKTIDELLDGRNLRRIKADDRAHDRAVKLEEKADRMVGELVRDGNIVNYVFPVGGRYREGSRLDLISFLIRNSYVS
jgi:hypothetical protein